MLHFHACCCSFVVSDGHDKPFCTHEISKALLPHIKEHGRVVNVASFNGINALEKCSPSLQKELHSNSITEEHLLNRMQEFLTFAKEGQLLQNGWPENAYDVSKLGLIVMSRLDAKWF